jgi:hypothetical protein
LRTLSLVMFCCPLLWSFVMVWIETLLRRKIHCGSTKWQKSSMVLLVTKDLLCGGS